jgi:UDP-glucose 4-epimerase
MKYLVTGSSGFIGSHLCARLEQDGHTIIPCDLKDKSGDIRKTDLGLENLNEIDGIFHLAAIASVQKTISDPQGSFDTNVTGARHVFEIAKKLDIPVVYASSAAVYGDNDNLPLKENESPAPLSPYAEHKWKNEQDALNYGQEGLKSFGVRFFNIYGPGQDPSSPYSGVISIFNDRLSQNLPITIYGNGLQSRDFVYVDDAVQALTLAMRHTSSLAPVANVCRGKGETLLDLARILGNLYHTKPDIRFDAARKEDIIHSLGSSEFLQKSLSFMPATALKDGLSALVKAS